MAQVPLRYSISRGTALSSFLRVLAGGSKTANSSPPIREIRRGGGGGGGGGGGAWGNDFSQAFSPKNDQASVAPACVTPTVVELLESIQVEQDQCRRYCSAKGSSFEPLQKALEPHPVGHAPSAGRIRHGAPEFFPPRAFPSVTSCFIP